MRSDNPVAVVTGGTGGIGAAAAKALAAAGFCVAVGFRRSAAAAQSVAAGLSGTGHIAVSARVNDSMACEPWPRRSPSATSVATCW